MSHDSILSAFRLPRRSWFASLLLPCLLLVVPSLAQAEPVPPKETVQSLVDSAFKILRDPQLKSNRTARIGQLRAAVDRVIDWQEMAKSSLGVHWRTASETQRSEFVNIFKDLLAKQYMEDVDRFQGTEQVKVKEAEARGELRLVKTTLVTASKEQVPIDYTLHLANSAWLVSDFSVEGVSIVNHFRSSFSRFLANKDLDALIKQLKGKLGAS